MRNQITKKLTLAHSVTLSGAVLDSPSVKATETSCYHGYDGAKQVKGIKRHILVDTLGLILAVLIHSAAIGERKEAHCSSPKPTL